MFCVLIDGSCNVMNMKSEFLKSLSSGLRDLRHTEAATRSELQGSESNEHDLSDDDDEEYQSRARPAKRRKVAHHGD